VPLKVNSPQPTLHQITDEINPLGGERTSVSRAIARDAAGTRRAQKCSEYTTNMVALPENTSAVGSLVRQTQGLCTAQSLMGKGFGVKRRLKLWVMQWHGFGTILVLKFPLPTL
jgi:hypothetical protein